MKSNDTKITSLQESRQETGYAIKQLNQIKVIKLDQILLATCFCHPVSFRVWSPIAQYCFYWIILSSGNKNR